MLNQVCLIKNINLLVKQNGAHMRLVNFVTSSHFSNKELVMRLQGARLVH